MRKFYNCSYDIVFKIMFCNEEATELLKHMIEEATGIKVDQLSFLSETVPKDKYDVKDMKVDLIVKSNNKVFNIELNNSNYLNTFDLKDRNLAYLCSYYGNSLKVGERYQDIKEHIQINYNFKDINAPLIEEYSLTGKYSGRIFTNKLKIIDINFEQLLKKFNENDTITIDKFKYTLLVGLDEDKLKQYCKGDELMADFNDKIEGINKSEYFANILTYGEDMEKQVNTAIYNAEIKGHDAGLKEGIEQGIEQGIVKGINQKSKETAINLSKNGVSKEIICSSLNISLEELENYLK